MKGTKNFIVIGLGDFGGAVAQRLHQNGCRVSGLDVLEDRVEELTDVLHEAIIADATDRSALEQLSLGAADGVFLSLGQRLEQSILAALHLKELGARRILAKGVSKEHGRILKKLGVEQVIYPEEEAGHYWADRETWPNVVDFLPIDPEYSLIEIAVPDELVGKTLQEANLRQRYGISVVGVKDVLRNRMMLIPGGDHKMSDDQILLVIGRREDLTRFRALK